MLPFKTLATAGLAFILISLSVIFVGARADARELERMMRECEFLLDLSAQPPPVAFDPRAPSVAIVHAYSSGQYLAPAMGKRGVPVIHIGPADGVPPNFEDTYWPTTFGKHLTHTDDLRPVINQLKDMNVLAVLPGTDTGVLLADSISTALNKYNPRVPTNGIEIGRKDKSLMQNALERHGVTPVLQMVTSDAEDALRWIRHNRLLDHPGKGVVIKPLMSAGGENVNYPRSESAVRDLFRDLLGREDGLGNHISALLVQEQLRGTEYVINSTVWDGHQVVTDIWKYVKRWVQLNDGTWHLLYYYDILMPYEGKVQGLLRAFNEKIIGAFGIRYGNCHPEIMVDAHGNMKLIEMNARPMGAGQPIAAGLMTGRSQIDLTALAVADPAAFARLPAAYTLRKNLIVFTIANLYDRPVRLNPNARAMIENLPAAFKAKLHVEPGSVMDPTKDMFSQIGEVWLVDDNPEVLMNTVERLNQMEKGGELLTPL